MASREEMEAAGFLDFEINALAPNVPPDVPYFIEMLSERASAYADAQAKGVSPENWEEAIRGIYSGNELNRDGEPDPWQLLRISENKYKDKNPEYESPSEKKKRTRKDFDDKYDRGEKKYPKGKAY